MRRSYIQARRVLALSVLASWVTACGSSDASPAASSVALSDFPGRYARVLCAGVEPCCQAAALTYDAAGCTSAATDSITVALGILASRQGTVYDAAAAAACLSELETALRECSVDRAPACSNLFTGTQPTGATCATSSACAGADAYCSTDGVCASAAPSACTLDATQCSPRDPDAASAQRCSGSL